MTPAAPASAEPMKNVDDDHAVDVDPHHRRRLAVVRGRPHRLAEPRPRRRERQREHQRDAPITITMIRMQRDRSAGRAWMPLEAGSMSSKAS